MADAGVQGLAKWRPELEAELGPLPTGFFDTPIIVYLLKTRPEYFERCAAQQSPEGARIHMLARDSMVTLRSTGQAPITRAQLLQNPVSYKSRCSTQHQLFILPFCRCRVYFELGPVGFNRHWLSVNWHEAEEPLVVHYAGCTTCSPPTDVISEVQTLTTPHPVPLVST